MPPTDSDLAACRVASLTIANAMIFQQVLAGQHNAVMNLERAVAPGDVAGRFLEAWDLILTQIDYVPIFTAAKELVTELRGNQDLDDALRRLARAAQAITSRRAALRHDLMGRIYHRLLADAKYLGAFYTTIPAAGLLLTLTLEPDSWPGVDFGDTEQLRTLRFSDLACGTGTLLKAALQGVADNHVRARADRGERPDVDGVHKALVEDVLWGFDVVPFAIHLAGSALALHEPNVTFGAMNLRTMAIAAHRRHSRLGSLDFIGTRRAEVMADLFGAVTTPERVTGRGAEAGAVELPELDLCVMNPPFTRSVGGNLLFGQMPVGPRKRLRKALKDVVDAHALRANITAGLGSVFAALGDQHLKQGGHLSLVVPRALITGVAWRDTRVLLGSGYHVRYIVVSHEPGGWNFSENTSLSECLVVARKLRPGELAGPTRVINLWTRPSTGIEAVMLARKLAHSEGTTLEGAGIESIGLGHKMAEIIQLPNDEVRSAHWGEAAAFAQTELCRVTHHLARGRLYIPGQGVMGEFPVTRVGDLAAVGPDRRDIHDAFNRVRAVTAYPAVWGTDTDAVRTLAQRPSAYLEPLARARRGRGLRDADLLWTRAGRLLVAERIRLTTARTVAMKLDELVLSNTWWPLHVHDQDDFDANEGEQILALWFNSTFGILSLAAARVDTEGPWVAMKKPILQELLVLDPRALTAQQRRDLATAYSELSNRELLAVPDIAADEARAEIDKRILTALGHPDQSAVVRSLTAAEPLFSGQRLPV